MPFQKDIDAAREQLQTILLTSPHPELQTCVFSNTKAKEISVAIDRLISLHVLSHMGGMHTPTSRE